jgi:hypothetical protein
LYEAYFYLLTKVNLLSCPWAWKLSQKVPAGTAFCMWYLCCDQGQHETETVYLKCRVNICVPLLIGWSFQLIFEEQRVKSGYRLEVTVQSKALDWRLLHLFKQNQQDATLHNSIYYCKCSTCFRRFLHPLSGAQPVYTRTIVFTLVPLIYIMFLCSVGRYFSDKHCHFPEYNNSHIHRLGTSNSTYV